MKFFSEEDFYHLWDISIRSHIVTMAPGPSKVVGSLNFTQSHKTAKSQILISEPLRQTYGLANGNPKPSCIRCQKGLLEPQHPWKSPLFALFSWLSKYSFNLRIMYPSIRMLRWAIWLAVPWYGAKWFMYDRFSEDPGSFDYNTMALDVCRGGRHLIFL